MIRLFFKILFRALVILLILGVIGALIFDALYKSEGYHGPVSDHFDGKRFHNIGEDTHENESIGETLGQLVSWITATRPRWEYKIEKTTIPPNTYSGSGMRITSVGHATFLIQVAGYNILTDPIWTDSPSPFGGVSHGRFVDPGIDFFHLPPIDVVLISHNHYDHLDIPTLIPLIERDNPIVYTGLGNSAYLKKYGITKSNDLDWFDQVNISGGVSITFVPSEHYSARAFSDRYRSLWGGFVIEGGGKSLYFAGDTGYGAFREKIREKYPSGFDTGLLPVGAYRPKFIMKHIHMNPREALMLQNDLSIRTAIGMHWGTFALGSDGQDEPLHDFEIAKKDFPTLDFRLSRAGEEWVFE